MEQRYVSDLITKDDVLLYCTGFWLTLLKYSVCLSFFSTMKIRAWLWEDWLGLLRILL